MPLINRQISEVIRLFKQRNQGTEQFFQLMKNSNDQMVRFLNDFAKSFKTQVKQIDFNKDFSEFVKTKKIIRYDISPPEFVPIDFSHPCFSNIKTISKIISPPLYPVAMAKPLSNFIAAEENQFNLQVGKCVLLMEPLDLPWCLVQNPVTRVMGYAPSSFLEIIGHGVGVLLKDFTTINGDVLNMGDYIALEKKENDNQYQIETVLCKTERVHSSLIGIISEF